MIYNERVLLMFRLLVFSLFLVSLQAREVEGITRPSSDVVLSFVRPGVVSKVTVKQGEFVKKGELLVQLKADLEENKVQQLKEAVANPTKENAEKSNLAMRKQELKDMEKAFKEGAGTQQEVSRAKEEVNKSEFTLQQMAFEKSQMKLQLSEAEILVKQTKLYSPIDGFVERVFTEEGEGIERLKETLTLVRIDPLWIDVPVPLQEAYLLKKGTKLKVNFPIPGKTEKEALTGTVIYRAAIADAGSETLIFRIEVPNPKNRIAGERVKIELPENK